MPVMLIEIHMRREFSIDCFMVILYVFFYCGFNGNQVSILTSASADCIL